MALQDLLNLFKITKAYLEAWIQLDKHSGLHIPFQNQSIESFNHCVDAHLVHFVWYIFSRIKLDNFKFPIAQYNLVILGKKGIL